MQVDKRLLVLEAIMGFEEAIKLPMVIARCQNGAHGKQAEEGECLCDHIGHTIRGHGWEGRKDGSPFSAGDECVIYATCQEADELAVYPAELEGVSEWNP